MKEALEKSSLVQALLEHKGDWVEIRYKSNGQNAEVMVEEITDDGYLKCSVQYESNPAVYSRLIPLNRIEHVEVKTETVWEEDKPEPE